MWRVSGDVVPTFGAFHFHRGPMGRTATVWTMRRACWSALAVAIALTTSTCGGSGDDTESNASSATTTTTEMSTTSTPTTLPTTTDRTQSAAPAGAPELLLADVSYAPDHVATAGPSVKLYLVNGEQESSLNESVKPAHLQHDLAIVDSAGDFIARSDRLAMGERALLTVEGLKPGTYKFYCTLPGHALGGMRAPWT